MNPSGDIRWHIDERINAAHKFAENWRLAQEARGIQPEWMADPRRKVRIIALLTLGIVSSEKLFAALRLGLKGKPHHA